MTGLGSVVWFVERVVYGGVDLLARWAPGSEEPAAGDSLLDGVLDAPTEGLLGA